MKLTDHQSTTTTVIKGEIPHSDLVESIRLAFLQSPAALELPKDAKIALWFDSANIEEGDHIGFTVTFESATPVPSPATDDAPMCSVGDCKFPSLAGGMCASHLSEAHRQRFPRSAGVPASAPRYVDRDARGEPR